MNNISVTVFGQSDLPLISKWRNDPRVNTFIRPGIRTLDEVQRWYHNYFSGTINKLYLISYCSNPIGYFTVEGINQEDKKCEFGIVIGEIEFQKRGIGTSVINMMLKRAFNEMGMHRVLAVINEDNASSVKCFTKAGFVLEGMNREARLVNNEYKDLLLFSIIESEFHDKGYN